MRKEVILHIGLPKTGSTSLQKYLDDHRPGLQAQGFDVWKSDIFGMLTHTELHLSALRPGVETFSTIRYAGINQAELRDQARKSIAAFIQASPAERLIFSSEGLSFLRTESECAVLRSLFPKEVGFRVILILRDPVEWLHSYTRQIFKYPGRTPSRNPNSALYVRNDTWLCDFCKIVSAYSAVFGEVETLNYDPRTMLPTILEAIGVKPEGDVEAYRLNRASQRPRHRARRAMLRSVGAVPLNRLVRLWLGR